MKDLNRRNMLGIGTALLAFPLLTTLPGCMAESDGTPVEPAESSAGPSEENTSLTKETGTSMKIQYLEIVCPDVDAACQIYEPLHDVKFGEPDANLGNARTAKLADGSLLGIRGPLRANEQPVVRPYFLVDDIEAAVAKAKEAGAEIALPPMKLPGHGTCALFIHSGIEHGLWQL